MRGLRCRLFGAAAVVLGGGFFLADPALSSPAESLRDVAYVEAPHAEQRLDFDWPGGAPRATVLFIHGGSEPRGKTTP